MKLLKFFLILSLYILVSSCGTVKEAFTNQKKNSSDEFLVEKKSPLVMPPEFNELPVPNSQNDNTKKEVNNIKELIGENKQDKNNVISNNDIEGSILDKIKTN